MGLDDPSGRSRREVRTWAQTQSIQLPDDRSEQADKIEASAREGAAGCTDDTGRPSACMRPWKGALQAAAVQDLHEPCRGKQSLLMVGAIEVLSPPDNLGAFGEPAITQPEAGALLAAGKLCVEQVVSCEKVR